jgi:hypothetical protein
VPAVAGVSTAEVRPSEQSGDCNRREHCAVLALATTVSIWQAVRATRAEQQAALERDQAKVEK